MGLRVAAHLSHGRARSSRPSSTIPSSSATPAWLTFGRLRPIHVNGVIWGAFSTLFIGLCHYIVPRLCGVRLWGARWSYGLLWVWNLNLALAVILLALGWNRGWEAGELPLINVVITFLGLVQLTVQFLMTIKHRTERPLYVSLWYLIAAFVWTDVNLVLLMLGPYHIPGINNAAWHGLFIHYVVGLWITPAGYVLIYYFLPASVRNPIYSHKLSLIGFWSLAFFYPFVGIHHYLYSPIADWAETIAIVSSMMLIIPVWTVLQNFFGTMIGRWTGLRTQPAREVPDRRLDHVPRGLLPGLARGAPRRSSSRRTSRTSSSRTRTSRCSAPS